MHLFFRPLTGVYTSEGTRETGTAELPEGVTSLGEGCFRFTQIQKAILPTTYINVGNDVFMTADKLTTIVFKGNIKTVESSAFWGKESSGKLTIDFSNCSTAPTGPYPPNFGSVFGTRTTSDVTLKVKAGTRDSYTASDCWKDCLIEEVGIQ